MVGDGYDTDVVGASKAGLRAVLKLNDREDLPEWQVDFKIRNLADLPALLDSLH
jgi:FMN phosphatase YigB (HAD superfamily)